VKQIEVTDFLRICGFIVGVALLIWGFVGLATLGTTDVIDSISKSLIAFLAIIVGFCLMIVAAIPDRIGISIGG